MAGVSGTATTLLRTPRCLLQRCSRRNARCDRSQRRGQIDTAQPDGWPGQTRRRQHRDARRGAWAAQLGAGFHPELTGRENAFVSGIVSGLTRRQVKQQFDAIVALAELEDAIDQPLRTFSTGMATRLAFSIAVHTSPDILLVDEVLAVGDTAFQQKCLQRIADIRKAGCAIVFVSHEMSLVANTCKRALSLDHGVVQEYGPPKAVVDHYLARLNSRTQSASAA